MHRGQRGRIKVQLLIGALLRLCVCVISSDRPVVSVADSLLLVSRGEGLGSVSIVREPSLTDSALCLGMRASLCLPLGGGGPSVDFSAVFQPRAQARSSFWQQFCHIVCGDSLPSQLLFF